MAPITRSRQDPMKVFLFKSPELDLSLLFRDDVAMVLGVTVPCPEEVPDRTELEEDAATSR